MTVIIPFESALNRDIFITYSAMKRPKHNSSAEQFNYTDTQICIKM